MSHTGPEPCRNTSEESRAAVAQARGAPGIPAVRVCTRSALVFTPNFSYLRRLPRPRELARAGRVRTINVLNFRAAVRTPNARPNSRERLTHLACSHLAAISQSCARVHTAGQHALRILHPRHARTPRDGWQHCRAAAMPSQTPRAAPNRRASCRAITVYQPIGRTCWR
jgi:hypothetical protein